MPCMIEGSASGICTPVSICQRVAPKARLASITSRVDLADAEIGEADERRRRVDDGGEDRRHLAEAEEHRRRDQVDEARDRLHQVEHAG